jgi:hypothetical protein
MRVRQIAAACKAGCRIAYTQAERKQISLSRTKDGPMLPRFKAAAVHAAPVFLDKQATTKRRFRSFVRQQPPPADEPAVREAAARPYATAWIGS